MLVHLCLEESRHPKLRDSFLCNVEAFDGKQLTAHETLPRRKQRGATASSDARRRDSETKCCWFENSTMTFWAWIALTGHSGIHSRSSLRTLPRETARVRRVLWRLSPEHPHLGRSVFTPSRTTARPSEARERLPGSALPHFRSNYSLPETAMLGSGTGHGSSDGKGAPLPATTTTTTHQSDERLLTLDELVLSAGFASRLPADPETANYVRVVRGAALSFVHPSPTWTEPVLAVWSDRCARACLDLELRPSERDYAARVFSGLAMLPGSRPYAQRYGGHQFGVWAGQLGDGRVIVLGEYQNRCGETWTLQLKGAGKTPFARFADGRAVLRSSVREFLASEALHALGIPTSRALSLVVTGDKVVRDMFYDGNPREEPGAVVCRLAPSWVRFGTFELATDWNELELLRQLADDTIVHHYPALLAHERSHGKRKSAESSRSTRNEESQNPMPYRALLLQVAERTAALVAGWQSVGFVHGVLNTDNMSILGITIDYGPFGFLDAYMPEYTPNTTDLPGRRYCYALQPTICLWNLLQLVRAFEPLTGTNLSEEVSQTYETKFREEMSARLRAKLGFQTWNSDADNGLVRDLYELMRQDRADFTRTWRALSWLEPVACLQKSDASLEPLLRVLPEPVRKNPDRLEAWRLWVQRYAERTLAEDNFDGTARRKQMQAASPKYILRNYMAQVAIEKAENEQDFSEIERLLKLLEHPYAEQPEMEALYDREPPTWSQRLGVCMNSCSS